jgi:hypothetical protein
MEQRQELVLRAAEELAAEGRPVMLILDDFSRIVSMNIAQTPKLLEWTGAPGLIGNIYNINQKMIVIAVCSSATAYHDMAQGSCWALMVWCTLLRRDQAVVVVVVVLQSTFTFGSAPIHITPVPSLTFPS